jgi:hypothetical protein
LPVPVVAKDQDLRVGTGRRRYIVAQRDNAGAFTNEDRGIDHPHERMRGL